MLFKRPQIAQISQMRITSVNEVSLKSVFSVFGIKIRVERLESRDHERYGINGCESRAQAKYSVSFVFSVFEIEI